MKKPTPDYIRDVAVSILRNFEMGIKQSDLWREVETLLVDSDYVVNQHTIKNALWDLESHRDTVMKVKKSSNNVELFPKSDDQIEEYDYDEAWEESVNDRAKGSLRNLSGLLAAVEIQNLSIRAKLVETQSLYMNHYSPEAVEAITNLEIGLEIMEKSFNKFKRLKGEWSTDSRRILP
ncbi:hypothetical protein SAMN05428987_3136 [Paenibacillus sp. CF095]|uniref:hypothetical protein n=1 Tax=Paenibacillus sp. CF095 TaxID=1881033 RepID=UPI00088CFDDD|nr:hypothetical protein [Paenibacillus sp. CF095]SDC87510.1 hypothetical protein SAMN05428987_3136 [Paenibacillus sp. CF095]